METEKIIKKKKELLEKANNLTTEPIESFSRFWQMHRFTEYNKTIVFLFLNKDGSTNFQLFFLRKEITNKLLHVLNEYGKKINKSVHFSSASFCKYSRRSENAYSISSMTIDLDFYNTKYKNYDITEIVWDEEFQDILTKYNLTLNYVIDSGNGAYLVFLLNQPIALQTETPIAYYYLEVYQEIVKALKPFGADPKIVDLARVFKLENTHNYKTGNKVIIRYENANTRNDFSSLLDAYFNRRYAERKQELHRIQPDGTFAKSYVAPEYRKSGYSNYNERRMNDLKELIDIRGGDIRYRNNFLFIVSVQMCYMKYPYNKILEQCLIFNRHFIDPYPQKEVERIVRYIKDVIDLPSSNREQDVYHCYRTDTIIEILDINETEMEQLDVLISKPIKKKRHNQRVNEYRQEKRRKKKAYQDYVEEKNCYGTSAREIATKLNTSTSTAYRKIHKHHMTLPKQKTMERENRLIILFKQQGKSNNEIAMYLDMNPNTLKTRITKLKKAGRL